MEIEKKHSKFSFSELSAFEVSKFTKSEEIIRGYINSDDVLGKIVLDPSGEIVGIAERLFLDPNKIEVVGISVDKGFLKNGLFIGKDYIHRIAKHSIFLKIEPVFKLKGMLVFDSLGMLIGRVRNVKLVGNKNKLLSLVVKRWVLGRNFEIPAIAIEKIDDNIILRGKMGDYI